MVIALGTKPFFTEGDLVEITRIRQDGDGTTYFYVEDKEVPRASGTSGWFSWRFAPVPVDSLVPVNTSQLTFDIADILLGE
jgi:hypothetical protein